MDDDAHTPSLSESERLRLLERLVRGQAVQLEAYRQQQEADRRKIADLARARAQEIVTGTGNQPLPTPPVPKPRQHRHRSPLPPEERWLRVVRGWLLPAGALALAGLLAGLVPVVRADDTPVHAAELPYALCDPPGFAPPSQDGLWELDAAPGGGRCIAFPTAVSGR